MYILQMSVLPLYFYFCIMRSYYIALVMMSINTNLHFESAKHSIRNKHMEEESCLQGSLQAVLFFFQKPFITFPYDYFHVVFTNHPYFFFLMKRLNNLQLLQPAY